MDIQARLTISRSSIDEDDGTITIAVMDDNSRVGFLQLKINNDDFIDALFGRYQVEAIASVKGLDLIGKTREQKTFSVQVPSQPIGNKDSYKDNLLEQCPDGWNVSTNLSSQNSIVYNPDDTVTLNTYIYRYV